MIKRKISTQKSFRIDNRILEYAQALADSTSRSLNDIVEIGLRDLIKRNSLYFIRNKIFSSMLLQSHFGYEDAGLFFKYDSGRLYLFTKNTNQQIINNSIKIWKTLDCYENDKQSIKSIQEKMGYRFFDFISHDDISNGKNKNKIEGWINLLEAHFELIDQNFPEMQEWIDKEFDFT